jgi:magnesium transporter
MIVAYSIVHNKIESMEVEVGNYAAVDKAIWIDLISPTKKEEKFIEEHLKLDVPTKKEMKGIEQSSRLYKENGSIFMTATMVAQSKSAEPKADAVTFILSEKKLITVRYIEPHSFKMFIERLRKTDASEYGPASLLIDLYEATTDRLADILETLSHKFDKISKKIFHNTSDEPIDYHKLLQGIGSNGDLGAKVRESLASFNRLLVFFEQSAGASFDMDTKVRLSIVMKDLSSLSDYASFISNKVNFLLDATLGMVSIEQNNIIKIFSVAAVIFLPPTLIASIYGMNFHHMPELSWYIGYPMAIVLMLFSSFLPYRYFKSKRWL